MPAEQVITAFGQLAGAHGGPGPTISFEELWDWSVCHTAGFWRAVDEFCQLAWETEPDAVTDGAAMPGTRWFPGGRINYLSQVVAARRTGSSVVSHDETGVSQTLSWSELEQHFGALAATLADLGVTAGDRVVGYLPGRPQAIVAFPAAATLGGSAGRLGSRPGNGRRPGSAAPDRADLPGRWRRVPPPGRTSSAARPRPHRAARSTSPSSWASTSRSATNAALRDEVS